MVYSLSYRRPAYAASTLSSARSEKAESFGESLSSGSTITPYGIPEALSFDRVISGGTCPPCTTRDFMNYLIYIELAAENLQFYLWFRDYIKRFDDLPENEKTLAKPWVFEKTEGPVSSKTTKPGKHANANPAGGFGGADVSTPPVKEKQGNPFEDDSSSVAKWDDDNSTLATPRRLDPHKAAVNAFEAADVKLQPFTIQPFREEITRIIATYISNEAPRQLNLASRERNELLHALASTTHPSAFQEVCRTVEWSLRHQAHPNFIRWTICNGNRPRVLFARGLGIGGIVGGILAVVLLTVSSAGRGWRAIAAIPFFIGIATLFAAWKGMCVVLHGMHHRHLRPWELFADSEETGSAYDLKNESFDSFGSSNSYEDEPWIARYEKRNVIRKVFDREVWIQEPALRQIQDTIFIQALLTSLLMSAVIVGVFVALPMFDKF